MKFLKCYEKTVKRHYFGRYISNKAYKGINKYSDSQGMNLRVISRKVKNRSKSKTIKELQKSSLPYRRDINHMTELIYSVTRFDQNIHERPYLTENSNRCGFSVRELMIRYVVRNRVSGSDFDPDSKLVQYVVRNPYYGFRRLKIVLVPFLSLVRVTE